MNLKINKHYLISAKPDLLVSHGQINAWDIIENKSLENVKYTLKNSSFSNRLQ